MQDNPPQLPTDPNLATEQQQAQNDLVTSLQAKTQGDMASLMSRYGTQLALSGVNLMPLASSPPSGYGATTPTGAVRAA